MEIYLVRHGESIGNTKKGFLSGRSDPDGLTKKGKAQILKCAWNVKDVSFSRIISSPVRRAEESAEIMSLALGVPLFKEDSLKEFSYGNLEGHFWWEVTEKLPPQFRSRQRENFETPYPGGDSFKMLCERIYAYYGELIKGNTSEKIILVSHQAVIGTILYVAKQGNPINNPQVFLAHIHSTFPHNSSAFRIVIDRDTTSIEQCSETPTIPVGDESVSFYLSSVLHENPKKIKNTRIRTGSRNSVFLIENKKRVIFKDLSDKQIVKNKRLVDIYTYLEKKTSIPAPHIVHFDETGVFFADFILIQDYQEGVEEVNCLTGHTKQVKSIQKTVYEKVSELHSIPLSDVKEFWYPDDWKTAERTSWKTFMQTEIGNTTKKLGSFPLPEKQVATLQKKLQELDEYVGSPITLVPLHGDLSPQNIIVNHKNGACVLGKILDFERARIGDKLWDLVYYYGNMELVNTEISGAWKGLFWDSLKTEEKSAFSLFHLLFHTWTIRDTFDYVGDIKRAEEGKKSLAILSAIVFPH